MYSNELAHHGTKGMKWGVRRYQNKDGSLTPAGKKRYGSLTDAVGAVKAYRIKAKRKRNLKKAREAAAAKRVADAEAKAKAEQRAKDVADGKISARKMTSEELQSRIDKLNLEKRYKQLMEETNPSSQVQSFGKTFVKKMWNEAVQPAAAEAGKAVLKDVLVKQLRKKTGLDVDDKSLDALNKEWKELDIKQKISNAKKTISDNEKHMNGEEDELTKLEKEARKAKAESTIATSKKVVNEANKYFDDEKAKDDAKAAAQKQVDEYNASRESSYSKKGKDIIDNVLYTRTSPNENIKDGRLLTDSSVKSTEVAEYSSRGKDVLDSVLDKDGNFIAYVK